MAAERPEVGWTRGDNRRDPDLASPGPPETQDQTRGGARTIPSVGDIARRPGVWAFLLATFLIQVAVSAQFTALGWRIATVTERGRIDLNLGLVGLAEFVPVALLVIVAGSVADRFDRRRVGATALTVEAVASVGLTVVVTHRNFVIGAVLALAFAYSVPRAFLNPALRSLAPTMVAPSELPRLNSLFIWAFQMGIIIGPVLGGFLYAVGPTWPFALSVAGFATAAPLLLLVRPLPQQRPSTVAETRLHAAVEGFRFIRGTPILLGAISLDLFAVLFGGAVALLPVIAAERLHAGSIAFGWLKAVSGIGAAGTTAWLAVRPIRRHVGSALFAVVGVFGAATIVLGVIEGDHFSAIRYGIAALALFVLSAADSVSVFIRSTIVPLVTPDRVRGRVAAVEQVFIGASNELGAAESGLLGHALGTGPVVVLGGVMTLLVAGLWRMLFPSLRTLDRFPTRYTEG
ncbi:MAG: MFS transporter [Microthrixaceae bacterium]